MRQSNKILHEAYDMLFRERVVRSHNRFSTDFLNKSPRYMSWLSANNNRHEPSIEACVALYVSLTELGSKLSVVRHEGAECQWGEDPPGYLLVRSSS